MWWAIGIGGMFLYVALTVTVGLITLNNGHGWMFVLGVFFPILWIVGACMQPVKAEVPSR
jgi:hypothetical protein